MSPCCKIYFEKFRLFAQRYIIVFMNLFFMSVGIWYVWLGITCYKRIEDFIWIEDSLRKYIYPVIFFIFLGSFITAVAIFGIAADLLQNNLLLKIYGYILLLVLLLLLSGGMYSFLLHKKTEDVKNSIALSLKGKLKEYNTDDEITRELDEIQETFLCCGGFSHNDYALEGMKVPSSCTNRERGCGYLGYKIIQNSMLYVGISTYCFCIFIACTSFATLRRADAFKEI